jgi:hypothetical protein
LPEGVDLRKEWEAALDALRWLRREIDCARRGAQQPLVPGDGDYFVTKLI